MSTDPIADMLVIIKNGQAVRKQKLILPASKIKKDIAGVLLKLKLIDGTQVKDDQIEIKLGYNNKEPRIMGLRRISKPGLRIYKNINELKKLNYKLGWFIISTPKGLMTANDAIKLKHGGEVIFHIW